ncbi:polyprenyl synthetase family protein [Streptacidiphilus sp. EB103A]|uniref:polyprenyl synthetase family protein n=1 Tax=Streptacidiphilus sp. EB103A TaxID=3156275 RepID=UPI003514E9B9
MRAQDPSADQAQQLHAGLREAQSRIEPALKAAVGRLGRPTRGIAEYYFGWTDQHGTPGGAASARRRLGVLALLAADVAGGSTEHSMPAAVACELAFSSVIIHDDIIDEDPTRRGRPSVWSLFGRPAAILTGNALTGLAFDALADNQEHGIEAVRRLARAVNELNDGQLLDIDFEQRDDVTLDECFAMYAGKASAFAECACTLGGLLAHADARHIDALAVFGHHTGLSWQLHNDSLAIWGDPALTGKQALSDLKSRKKTFPVIAALASTSTDRDRLAELYLRGQTPLSNDDAQLAADLIERCGARQQTDLETEHHLSAALHALGALIPDSQPRTTLEALARLHTQSHR